jgi:hypothetical protein
MKTPRRDEQVIQTPDLKDRLLMAFLAPILFNVAIVTVIAMFFRHSRLLGRVLYSGLHVPGLMVWITTVLLPVIAGFMMGSARFATLFGHFFYTHSEIEKDLLKILAAWLGLFALAWFISDLA